jgi:hypothetical protein
MYRSPSTNLNSIGSKSHLWRSSQLQRTKRIFEPYKITSSFNNSKILYESLKFEDLDETLLPGFL